MKWLFYLANEEANVPINSFRSFSLSLRSDAPPNMQLMKANTQAEYSCVSDAFNSLMSRLNR